MKLNQKKLESKRSELRRRIDELEALDHSGSEELTEELRNKREQLSAINQVVLRNVSTLPRVSQKVFVSTNHSSHVTSHNWTTQLIEAIKKKSNRTTPKYELFNGITVGGKPYRDIIVKEIAECYCFVAIALPPDIVRETETGARERADTPLSPGRLAHLFYLHEELGIAFALCKPIVLALHESLLGYNIGPISASNLTRISFAADASEKWIDSLAGQLAKALKAAPSQMSDISSRKSILDPIFR